MENVHKRIVPEATQNLSFSHFDYVIKWETLWSAGVKVFSEGKNWVFSIFLHLSSFCVIFICRTGFSCLNISVQCCFRYFPIGCIQYFPACLVSLTHVPGSTASPFVGNKLSFQCPLVLLIVLSFLSLLQCLIYCFRQSSSFWSVSETDSVGTILWLSVVTQTT